MKKIIIKNKFQLFDDYWNPKIIGSINDHDVKLAKVKGEFVWHNHENEDELFLVIKGELIIEFQDKKVELNKGEMLIVPKEQVVQRKNKKQLCDTPNEETVFAIF